MESCQFANLFANHRPAPAPAHQSNGACHVFIAQPSGFYFTRTAYVYDPGETDAGLFFFFFKYLTQRWRVAVTAAVCFAIARSRIVQFCSFLRLSVSITVTRCCNEHRRESSTQREREPNNMLNKLHDAQTLEPALMFSLQRTARNRRKQE